jgi:hypothetical protein
MMTIVIDSSEALIARISRLIERATLSRTNAPRRELEAIWEAEAEARQEMAARFGRLRGGATRRRASRCRA